MQQFILVGIDHGTTNSCVSIMTPNGPEIQNADSGDLAASTLPSYVHMSKESGIQIGALARNAVISKAPGTGYTGYKLRIGSDDRFAFPEVDRVLTAPQMGQLVLSKLLEPCSENLGYPPLAAVITVPAKFSKPKYDGTRKASELAGLEQIVLLQEPIAASLAYGFGMKENAKWIVFDLGGGTLDVSLVSLRNGTMEVPENGNTGDADLGGRLFDSKLIDYVVGPKKDEKQKWRFYQSLSKSKNDYKPLRLAYAMGNFNERVYPSEWGRLALAVEDAKIRLSKEEETAVEMEGVLCKDDNDREIEVSVPLSRKVYEKLIEPDVNRAINCCRTLLRNNRLKSDDIDFILMVGGPSKTPYIQRQLSKRLGIALKKDLDPMTVVGNGAAIHAATKTLDPKIIEKLKANQPPAEVEVDLSFEPYSQDDICPISGQISSKELDDFSGLTVQITRTDNDWETTLLVEDDGWFEGEVFLIRGEKPIQSEFLTVVKDSRGNALAKADMKIWHPFVESTGSKLANGLKIQTHGNNTRTLLEAGSALPAEEEQDFNTVKAAKGGNPESKIIVNVLEGVNNLMGKEDWRADCNMKVGQLIVRGDQLDGDLPANSKVEIRLHEDESRKTTVNVYIPFFDKEFAATFDSLEKQPDLVQMRNQFADVKRGLEEARLLARESNNEDVDELFEMIADEHLIEDIEDGMKKISEDGELPQLLAGTYKKILCLAGTANCIYDLQQRIRLQARIDKLAEKVKDDDDKEQFGNLQAAFDRVDSNGDKTSLDKVEKDLGTVSALVQAREIFDLTIKLDAISWCLGNEKEKYFLDLIANVSKLAQIAVDVKGARDFLDSLYRKAGWREGEQKNMDMIFDLAKRNLITKEEIDEINGHLARINAFPRIDEMRIDFIKSLGIEASVSSSSDGSIELK